MIARSTHDSSSRGEVMAEIGERAPEADRDPSVKRPLTGSSAALCTAIPGRRPRREPRGTVTFTGSSSTSTHGGNIPTCGPPARD